MSTGCNSCRTSNGGTLQEKISKIGKASLLKGIYVREHCNINQLWKNIFHNWEMYCQFKLHCYNKNVDSLISLHKDNDVQFEVITSLLYYSSAKKHK